MTWKDGCAFLLDDETEMVRDTARNFAENEVLPLAAKIDQEHYFPKELIPKMAALGFMGATFPAEVGGAELSYTAYALIIEELAAACASTSIIVSAHNSLCLWPIVEFGTDFHLEQFAKPLASGKALGCFALSEPGTGSDAAALTCTATRDGKGYVLNGTKNWITNGPEADMTVVFATLDPSAGHKGVTAFVHRLDLEGVQVGKREEKLGICGSPTSSLTYDGVRLSEEHRLGGEGGGFRIAMHTLNGGRIGVAAQAVGIARAALRDALAYSKDREAFGQRVCDFQSIQNYLAEMVTRIDASRYLTLGAAGRKDRGESHAREAAMAKWFSSEAAMYCANKGIQIHGGYGFVKEFPAERHYRDAKITELYEGTSEIQKMVIASGLIRE